jgi:hypothetical protein
MCFNLPILSWFTAIAVVGWSNRLVQASVLKSWWRRSDVRGHMTFAEFCDSLGPDAPMSRPRWFWQERPLAHLSQPAPEGLPSGGPLLYRLWCWLVVWVRVAMLGDGQGSRRPGLALRTLRILCWPWHSLWLNFQQGLVTVICTALLLGVPLVMICWSWEQGWINSFGGGYEEAARGAMLGIIGSLLFAAAMVYVPMAQTHQAVTGRARSFFEFRLVWQLIVARLTTYVMLALAIGFFSLLLHLGRDVVLGEDFWGNVPGISPEEGLVRLRRYLFGLSLVMFPLYVLQRVCAAHVYQSAVLKALRSGAITYRDLNTKLVGWHQALNLKVVPRAQTIGLGWAARLVVSTNYRRGLVVGLFLIWVLFLVRFYAGYFFVYDPYVGILNQPLVEIPCFDFIPQHLYAGRDL